MKRTIQVSRGRNGWQLRIEGSTIALFPTSQDASAAARDMANRFPDTYDYQGKRSDQILFSVAMVVTALWGIFLLLAIAAVYQWLTK